MDTCTDTPAAKAATRAQWDRAAEGWDRHGAAIEDWLRRPTAAMVDMARIAVGASVLDVAAGAGGQTVVIAERVGPSGHVIASDLSPALVDRARRNLGAHPQVDVQVGDGEELAFADASVDAVVCRLGLMLFPDPLRGLREMHRVLRPGGTACAMVFAQPALNPCLGILMSTAMRHAGLPPPDPSTPGGLCSLGDVEGLERLMRGAGFEDVRIVDVDAPFALPSVDDYLDFVRDSAGPVRDVVARLAPDAAERAWQDMRERLDVFSTGDGWVGPNRLLLAAGRR